LLIPSRATFPLTHVATIPTARNLCGTGSSADRAITQAWDAVGVQERELPTAALLPNPAIPSTAICTGLSNPHWVLGVTASAGSSTLRITQWVFDFFDHTGAVQDHEVFSATSFTQSFNQCGTGSSTIRAQTDACTAFCVSLSGDTSGAAQITFNAVDDAGRPVVFSTPRTTLLAR
jgi:hypothetical protein